MVTINIATIPERESLLINTIKSLYDQADRINIWLNNYKTIPLWLSDTKIKRNVGSYKCDSTVTFNLTILFIAHDLSVVNHISTEIAVMYLGEVVEYNKTKEIFKNPQHQYTKTLLAAIPQPNPVGREERIKKRKQLS